MTLTNPTGATEDEQRAYVRELMELLGDREPLDVLAELVPHLRAALGDVDEETLRTPESPGKWSVMEVVRHLADTELVYRYRMRMIVAQPGSEIPAYDQDEWAEGLAYRSEALGPVLEELDVLREADLRWIRGLTEEQLERYGVHAERGRESVGRIVRLLAAHDLVHRRQIDRIRAAVGRAREEAE